MSDQLGFSFADESRPNLVEDPPGTWLEPEFTAREYRARVARARERAGALPSPLREFVAHALDLGEAELEGLIEHNDPMPNERFHLWHSSFRVTSEDVRGFVEHCRAMSAGSVPAGHEYRVRPMRFGEMAAGVYIDGVGSLILRQWKEDNCGAEFDLWRSTFFLASYDDNAPRFKLAEAVWSPAYACQRIAEARGVASVPTFTYQGREYTNCGGMGSRELSYCHAWSFVPLADWVGPTYTYQQKNKAYDDGRKERGDSRGLVVLVRGRECVLDALTVFYDDTPAEQRLAASARVEEEEADEGDELDNGEFDDAQGENEPAGAVDG